MYPRTAGAPAGVLPGRDWPPAAVAVLPGRAGRAIFPAGRITVGGAESERRRAGHRHPQTPRAEMLQVRLDDPLADRRPAAPGREEVTAGTRTHQEPG